MEDPSVRTERIIAGARLVLAIAAIELVLLDPSQSLWEVNKTYSVVAMYFLYSLGVIWVVDRNLMRVHLVGFYTQAIDTLWFPVILISTQGENSPFFLCYVFSLITASFRWGFTETLFVNTANVGMYGIVYFATVGNDFGFFKLWVRPIYLYVLAFLIGYLGEHQKRAQKQLLSLAELSRSIRIKDRFSRMLEELMDKVRKLFQAEQCILIFFDQDLSRFFLKKVLGGEKDSSYQTIELQPEEAEFLLSPRKNWGYLINSHKRITSIFGFEETFAYDFEAQKSVSQAFQPDKRLNSILEMKSVLSVPILSNEQFKGRVYLVNKIHNSFSNSDLQYLKLIVSQVGPLLENYRLLKRMQTISVLEEKNRIARDLHDGLVQSLASLDLRITVCLKLCRETPQAIENELVELQSIIKDQYCELRNYMKQLKAPAFASNELVEAIQGYLQAFEKENGLAVKLCIDPDKLDLPRRIGREIYQMILEGLTNVKKHASAHQVLVKLNQDEETANLVISDDGHGFPCQAGKGSSHKMPWSIHERTQSLGGTLTVESVPGKGSSLFICIPITGNVNNERRSAAKNRTLRTDPN